MANQKMVRSVTIPKSSEAVVKGRDQSPKMREKSKATKANRSLGRSGLPAATLKDRVEQAAEQSEPIPTTAESDAVRFAISVPGLLDEVREEAFVELAGVVQRKLAKNGVHLTQPEATNVAWWIVGHPDDVPDALGVD